MIPKKNKIISNKSQVNFRIYDIANILTINS